MRSVLGLCARLHAALQRAAETSVCASLPALALQAKL